MHASRVGIRRHTSAYVSIRQRENLRSCTPLASASAAHTLRIPVMQTPRVRRSHTSAYVGIRRHTSAYAAHTLQIPVMHVSRVRRSQTTASFLVSSITTIPSTCIRQHTSAYVSIRQHTSAYVSIRQHTSAYVRIRQHTSEYVSIRQYTSAYVSIRPHGPGRRRARSRLCYTQPL
jgi:hypothetical protein